jgi:uncharacterized protein
MQPHITHTAIAGFEWDEGNREKWRKHGVSIAEIEGLFDQPHTIHVALEHSLGEERLKAIGKSRKGCYIFLAFTIRKRNGERLRPADQRPVHAQEGGGAL